MTGHFYKSHLNLSDQAAASVRQALHQAAPHIVFGYTPGNQLVYKKRHLKQIEDNLSQLTRASSGGQSSAGEEILFASSSLLIIM